MKSFKDLANAAKRKVADSDPSTDSLQDPFLFHVTYYGRLEMISERGLVPGSSRSIGGRAYDAHSKGRVFLTAADGIRFWFQRAIDHATHSSDAVLDDLLVPVVLRVRKSEIEVALSPDEVGSEDAKHDAFFFAGSINPNLIEVWGDGEWWGLDGADIPDPLEGGKVEERQEEGETFQLQSLKDPADSPFFPPDDETFTEYE